MGLIQNCTIIVILFQSFFMIQAFSLRGKIPPCNIEGVNDLIWSYYNYENAERSNDNYVGVVKTFNSTEKVKTVYIDGKYLTATLENEKIIISTTEEIFHFEEVEVDDYIKERLVITCINENEDDEKEGKDEEYSFQFKQNLVDINSHDPKFSEDIYTFVYRSYQNKSTTLTDAQPITITDLDMSSTTYNGFNVEIEDNAYFSVKLGSSLPSNRKTKNVILNTEADVKGPFSKTFRLTTTDIGKPNSRSSSSILVVILHTEEIISFTESLYIATFANNEIVIENGPITLENEIDFEATTFTITSEIGYEDSFEIIQDVTSIKLVFVKPIDENLIGDEDYIFLIINAEYTGNVGKCAVLIQLIKEDETTELYPDEEVTESQDYPDGIQTELEGFRDWLWGSSFLIGFLFGIGGFVTLIFMFVYRKLLFIRNK